MCTFLDARRTPTDAILYLELGYLGTLKDLENNMEENGQPYTHFRPTLAIFKRPSTSP
jgi:hypothetical protein